MQLKLTHATRHSLRAAIAIILACIVAIFLQAQQPYWAAISAAVVMTPYLAATFARCIQRIIGTLIGASLAMLCISLVSHTIVAILITTFLAIFISQYLSLCNDRPYLFTITSVTFLLVIGTSHIGTEQAIFTAFWRCVEIIIGVVSAGFTASYILPANPRLDMQNKDLSLQVNITQALRHLLCGIDVSNDLSSFYQRAIQLDQDLQIVKQEPELNAAVSQKLANIGFMQRRLIKLLQHEATDLIKLMQIDNDLPVFHKVKVLQVNIINYATAIAQQQQSQNFYQLCHDSLDELEKSFQYLRNNINEMDISSQTVRLLHVFIDFNIRLMPILYNIDVGLRTFTQTAQKTQTQLSLLSSCKFIVSKLWVPLLHTRTSKKKLLVFSLNKYNMQHAIKTALGVILALVAWLFSGWPGGIQGIISSVIMGQQKYVSDSQLQGWMRILGCVLGGSIALFALHFVIANIYMLLAVSFFVVWLFAYITFVSKKYSYIGLQANIAYSIVAIDLEKHSAMLLLPLERLSGILLGVSAILLVSYILWPMHPKTVFNKYYRFVRVRLLRLGQQIIGLSQHENPCFARQFVVLENQFSDLAKLRYAIRNNDLLKRLDKMMRIQSCLIEINDKINLSEFKRIALALNLNFELVQHSVQQLLAQFLIPNKYTHVNAKICRERAKAEITQLLQIIRHAPQKPDFTRAEIGMILKYLLELERMLANLEA